MVAFVPPSGNEKPLGPWTKWFGFLQERNIWSRAGQLEGELWELSQFPLLRVPTEGW